MQVQAASAADAESIARKACQELLANPVMESFSFAVRELS
jgi:phosphoribosylformylglycinamidine (FGAM) synthase PurS component